MKKLLALSRSRLLLILFCLAFFAQMFLCTHWTDLIADDYRYCFSYADDTRIESVAQIFPSMQAHRQSMVQLSRKRLPLFPVYRSARERILWFPAGVSPAGYRASGRISAFPL